MTRSPLWPRAARRLALAVVVAAVVVLSSALASPAAAARQVPRTVVEVHGLAVAPARSLTAPAAVSRPATTPNSWAGTVVATDLLNYNASLSGNFRSSVEDWQVGAPAYVPTTGTVWWPELDVEVGGAPNDTVAPALLYNVSTRSFVGVDPYVTNASAFAYDPTTGRLYATEPRNDTVVEVNVTSGLLTGTVYRVGADPTAIVLDLTTGYLFVANTGSSSVTVIDPVSHQTPWPSVGVMADPTELVTDERDNFVYVGSETQSQLDRLNASSPTAPETSTGLADGPTSGLAFSNRTDVLAVSSVAGPNMTLVSGSSGDVYNSGVTVGTGSAGIAAVENGFTFLLCNYTSDTLDEINASTFTVSPAHLAVGENPRVILSLSSDGPILVWSDGTRNVSVVSSSLGSVYQSQATLGAGPTLLAYDGSLNRLYVGDPALPGIEVIDPFSGVSAASPIRLRSAPLSISVDAISGTILVGLSGEVLEIYASNNSLAATNTALAGPNAPLVIDPSSSLVWVGRESLGEVIALESNSLVSSGAAVHIAVNSSEPDALALDPQANAVLALNATSGRVAEFNGTTGTLSGDMLAAGANVSALLWDPADQLVYAAGDGLAAIDPTTMTVVLSPISITSHSHVGGLSYDSSREAIYLATWSGNDSGSLTVVNGSSPGAASSSLTVIPTGFEPSDPLSFVAAGSALPGSGTTLVADTASGTISVIGSPPQILSASFEPSKIDAGSSTNLQVIAVGGAGSSSFSYVGLPSGCVNTSTAIVTCTPTESGTFTVIVTVTDEVGLTAASSVELDVASALTVQVTVGSLTSHEADAHVAVAMSALATGGTPGYSYSWNFGNGATATGSLVSYTYGEPGEEIVAVTATDAAGGKSVNETLLTVEAYPTVQLSVAPQATTDVNLTLDLSAAVIGGAGPVTGTWTFGDGTGSDLVNTTHAWQRAGLYQVNYTATDALGIEAKSSLGVLVDPVISGSFLVTPESSSPVVGTVFDFNASLTGGTPGYAVIWSFGDGSNATGLNVTHAYGSAGSYTVEVVAYDSVGGSFSESISDVDVGSGPAPAAPLFGGGFGPSFLLGIVLGGTVAAVALFLAERSRRAGPAGPPSPYVPPAPPAKGR